MVFDSNSESSRRSRGRRAKRRMAEKRGRALRTLVGFEDLEPRMVLTVIPSILGVGDVDITFDASDREDVYLRTNGGFLEWRSSDDSSYSRNFGDGGDSGLLTIEAINIKALSSNGTGATIVTHADNGFSAGAITLEARDDETLLALIPVIDITTTDASVELTDATIKGGDITIKAIADSTDFFDSDSDAAEFFDTFIDFLAGLSFLGGVAVSTADANLEVSGGSIDGANIELVSEAKTDAETTVVSKFGLAVAYGGSFPTAKLNILDQASITSSGNLTLDVDSYSSLNIDTTNSLVGLTTSTDDKSVAFSVGTGIPIAQAKVGDDTTLNVGGDLQLTANTTIDHHVASSAAAYADGSLGIALAVLVSTTDVEATLGGDVTAGGDIVVAAEVDSRNQETKASA